MSEETRVRDPFESIRETWALGHALGGHGSIEQGLAMFDAAVAPRQLLTDAAQQRLIQRIVIAFVESALVPTGVRPELLGEVFTIRERVDAHDVAIVALDAILADSSPAVSTSERLAEAIAAHTGEHPDKCAAIAQSILASGAVDERAEVEAKALEAEAENWGDSEIPTVGVAWVKDALRGRAASIREGRA